jgi:hypothetical protein
VRSSLRRSRLSLAGCNSRALGHFCTEAVYTDGSDLAEKTPTTGEQSGIVLRSRSRHSAKNEDGKEGSGLLNTLKMALQMRRTPTLVDLVQKVAAHFRQPLDMFSWVAQTC